MGSINSWWRKWSEFIFEKKITIQRKKNVQQIGIYELFSPISKAKYPDISDEEEAASIPLQTICLAIFDSILIHMLNQVSPLHWQRVRREVCNGLNREKLDHSLSILETTYGDYDVAFLQEVTASFSAKCENRKISEYFDVVTPTSIDTDRDQNSFILLKKGRFVNLVDETAEMISVFPTNKPIPVAAGDLFVISATEYYTGQKYLFASFHGDTNGLATIPVVNAMHEFASSKRKAHKLLFGMDANTYKTPQKNQQGVLDFVQHLESRNLRSSWIVRHMTDLLINYTTYCARTHLQPQLNKAASIDERDIKGDRNPKDFIVFFNSDFSVLSTTRDNTGVGKFIDDMVFPSLSFPSDHAISSTILQV